MKSEIKTIRAKYKKAKDSLQLSWKNGFDKDLKISRLETQQSTSTCYQLLIPHQTNEAICPNVATSVASNFTHSSDRHAYKFNDFQNIFEESELAKLRSIDDDRRSDQSFIRLVLGYLYRDNIGVLSERSVNGTKQRQKRGIEDGENLEFNAMEPLSPAKKKVLIEMFSERISMSTQEESQKKIREKSFNHLAAKAICYLRSRP